MKFKPGQSGNPGGRPKLIVHVRELARSFTDEAIQTLAGIMRDKKTPAPARVSACAVLLDRGWGKPEAKAHVDVNRTVRDLSTQEILAILHDHGVIPENDAEGEPGAVH